MKRARPQQPGSRRGASLVELIITMTIGGVVLSMGIGTLHLLLRTETTLADSLWRSRTVSQLSRTFRGDVHAARNVDIEPPANEANANEPAFPVLTIELAPDHFARYSVENQQLVRAETKDQTPLRTERFRFAPGTTISLDAENPSRLAVVIHSPNLQPLRPRQSPLSVPVRELKIEAVKGRAHRFEGSRDEGAD